MAGDPTQLLCGFQKAWLRESEPLAIGEKSRRIGWTWTQALRAVLDRARGDRGNYYHSSADQSASDEFIDYCSGWAGMVNEVAAITDEKEVIDDEEISIRVMRFANGTKIVAGSSNPKFFRSKGGAVGLDELAFHRDGRELFKAAHATALFWGYPLRAWSTHNGPGSYFNQMITATRKGDLKASLHKVTIEDAVREGIVERIEMRKKKLDHVPAADEGRRKAWLGELRATCPDEGTWLEEYLCVPSSEEGALLSYKIIGQCEAANLQLAPKIESLPTEGGPLYAGYDVARRGHKSVLWVIEPVGDVYTTRLLLVYADTPFTNQEEALASLLGNRRVRRLCIDRTGIGWMLAERLQMRFGARVEPVHFTASLKEAIAMPLVRLFEDRLVRVPSSHEVREDLHGVRKVVVATGIRLDAQETKEGHSDRFWALALAAAAADTAAVPLPPPMARKPVGW